MKPKPLEQIVVKPDDSWAKIERNMRWTAIFLTISAVALLASLGIRIWQALT